MALKQPDIKNLARRMAMLNIEPETLQKQIQPSLGLGDLSAPSFQAKDVQVADNSPWISGSWGRIGPFTGTPSANQAADSTWEKIKSDNKAKAQEGAPVAPTAAKPAPTGRTGKPMSAPPSLGDLMAPRPVGPAPAPVAPAPMATPAPQAAEPFVPIAEVPAPLQAAAPGVPDAIGPTNEGEKSALAEGTMSQKQLTDEFMQSIRAGSPEHNIPGLTNPYGLAAVMSTGTHESAFAPANVFGKWNDPSESGQAGVSGGALSWREERYRKMQSYVESMGGDTARNQALFFLQEDPNLVAQLQNAKDPAEAQQMMNQAWRFAGYNEAGGEAGDRIATAQKLAPAMQQPDTGMLSSVAQTPPPQQVPNGGLLSQPMNGDGRFTVADIDPTVSSAVPLPEANPNSIFPPAPDASNMAPMDPNADKKMALQKIGQLINSMKKPQLAPPTGTAPAPSQGSYNRDPNALKAIMAMLAGPSGPSTPSLGQLMGGGR